MNGKLLGGLAAAAGSAAASGGCLGKAVVAAGGNKPAGPAAPSAPGALAGGGAAAGGSLESTAVAASGNEPAGATQAAAAASLGDATSKGATPGTGTTPKPPAPRDVAGRRAAKEATLGVDAPVPDGSAAVGTAGANEGRIGTPCASATALGGTGTRGAAGTRGE